MNNKELYEAIGFIKGKVEGIDEKFETMVTSFAKYDERLTTVEVWKSMLIGKITVMTTIVAFVFSLVGAYLKDIFAQPK